MKNLETIKSVLRTQHGGPGPHKDGSPQDVHGGGRGGSTSSSTTDSGDGAKFKEKEYKVPKDAHPAPSTGTRMTFTPEDGGYLFHGTRLDDSEEYPFADRDGVVFFTDDFLEAQGYAQGKHLGGYGTGTPRVMQAQLAPGKMADVSGAIDDAIFNDEDIGSVFRSARDQGFDYAFYTHPTFSSENDEQRVIVALNPGNQVGSLNVGWNAETGKLWRRPRGQQNQLNRIRLVLSHGGPGPHKSGSSQDVHGDPGAGSTSTSTTAKAGRPEYAVRETAPGDLENLTSGAGDPAEWNTQQKQSEYYFDDTLSKVLVDSNGLVQGHYLGELTSQENILEFYEFTEDDMDDYTDVGRHPFEVKTLGVAPRNLGKSGGERGWGLHVMHSIIADARDAGADYIILGADQDSVGFYEHIGMLNMGDIGAPGLMTMSKYRMDKFEEAYDARFK